MSKIKIDKDMLGLHYNVFQSIGEQLKEQGYKLDNIEFYEGLKKSIFTLEFQHILTNSEVDRAINRLHKKIAENVERIGE